MWTLFERSHHQLFNVSSSPTFWGVVTGVWMIIGILVSIALQLVWIGSLGPIFSVVEPRSDAYYLQLRARRQPDWRTRPTMLELSKTAGLTLGAGLALICTLTSLMFGLGWIPVPSLAGRSRGHGHFGRLNHAGLPSSQPACWVTIPAPGLIRLKAAAVPIHPLNRAHLSRVNSQTSLSLQPSQCENGTRPTVWLPFFLDSTRRRIVDRVGLHHPLQSHIENR